MTAKKKETGAARGENDAGKRDEEGVREGGGKKWQGDAEYPSISNRQYLATKRSLKRKEKDNYDKIYLIYCEGKSGWCEAAEHSALFYYYEVAARLGLKNQFFADTLALYDGYEIGYVRIRDMDAAVEMVKRAGLYLGEGRDSQGTFYVELKKPYSEDKVQHYLKREKQRRMDQLAVTPAHNLAPEFYQVLIGLGARVHKTCNAKLDRLTADSLGTKIVGAVDGALRHYHYLTYIEPENIEVIQVEWKKIRQYLKMAIADIRVLSDCKLLKYETCLDFADILEHLVTLTEQAERRAEKKAAKTIERKAKAAQKVAKKAASESEVALEADLEEEEE